MTASPNQDVINTALTAFLVGVLPPGTKVLQGQSNRVSEPQEGDYVVFWPISRARLTINNIDDYKDAVFTGSISGNTLDITLVDPAFKGKLAIGVYIFGVGVADNTVITALGTGTGGVGTYTVSIPQTIPSQTITGGTANLQQKMKNQYQCDVHGPNSADNAVAISIAMWDPIADRFFKSATTGVSPLYSDDPRQLPFLNGEDQYEDRWIVDVYMQTNQTVFFSQEFAAAADVAVVSVSATYPV